MKPKTAELSASEMAQGRLTPITPMSAREFGMSAGRGKGDSASNSARSLSLPDLGWSDFLKISGGLTILPLSLAVSPQFTAPA